MLDYAPMSATEQRKRWPAAVAKEWDIPETTEAPPDDADRPGVHPEHVMDFWDGLRLIVSLDRFSFGVHLHVSASLRPRSALWTRAWKSKLKPGDLGDIVIERVRFLSGRNVTLCFITQEKGVPHFYDPPLPANVLPAEPVEWLRSQE